MTGDPKVSIIIPAYNYAQFIPETIASLQRQMLEHWECWVIDDGSTDETGDVVGQIATKDSRVRYWYQQNQGQPAARNAGIERAVGKYLQFLDADDLIEPQKLSRQVQYLEEHPEADIVYGDVCYFTSAEPDKLFLNRWGEPMEPWMPAISGSGIEIVEAFIRDNIFELGCGLFRRDVMARTGLFDVQLQGVEDYDYCFRAATQNFYFAYLPAGDSRCRMRHHPGSFSKNRMAMYRRELMLREKMYRWLSTTRNETMIQLNRSHYASRLKKLQDLIIDQTIKSKARRVSMTEMKWLYRHSDIRQNLYFFPRIVKALLSNY